MNNYILLLLLFSLAACGNTDTTPQAGIVTNAPATAVQTATVSPSATKKSDKELESPDIKITIQGGKASLVRLIGMFQDRQYLADSARMDANGVILLKRAEPYKPGLLYVALKQGGALQLLITEDQTFEMTTNINDLAGAMQVTGSLDNEILYKSFKIESAIQAKMNPLSQQMKGLDKNDPKYQQIKAQRDVLVGERKTSLDNLFQQYPNSFFTAFKKAGQNPTVKDIRNADGSINEQAQVYAYRTEFWDNVDFSDDRLLYTPVITNKLKRYINELTPQHPDSIISAASFLVDKSLPYPEYFQYFANWITLNYDPKETSLMDPQAVYVYMIQNYFTKERAFWASSPAEIQGLQTRAYEMAASIVGKKGPNVTAKNPKGELKSLYDLKAPYLIVYMYNPDCEHCQEQTPKLVEFYKEWKNKGVDVYAIVLDTDQQKWEQYIAKTGMTFTNVFDPTNKAIYATYYVDQTPELYVLNPDRIIIGKNLKVNQIETIIDRDKNK